jgi:hypothetical protein
MRRDRFEARYYTQDWYDDRYQHRNTPVKPYGALSFLGDVFMFTITGGLWLIWIFVRESRRRNVRHY